MCIIRRYKDEIYKLVIINDTIIIMIQIQTIDRPHAILLFLDNT